MNKKEMPAYFTHHERNFEDHLYTYPVISRRAGGLSIGINLSLIKECNFACEYCQVDRNILISRNRKVDFQILLNELNTLTDLAVSKELFTYKIFENTPENFQILRDISFSGDGESTASPYFIESAKLVMQFIAQKQSSGIEIKPIVITNGTMLHKETICDILRQMYAMGGGAWIKLDAGNEKEFQKVSDTGISFEKIQNNIIEFSRTTPIILQTILYQYSNGNYSFTLDDYIDCILRFISKDAKLEYIQLYTLARSTKVKDLESASIDELERRAKSIKEKSGVEVKIYP